MISKPMSFLEWIKRKRKVSSPRSVTRDEVLKHNRPDDCWIIMDGVVYDITKFLLVHPAGMETIMEYAGMDCTEAFNRAHAYINKEEILFNEVVGFLSG